MNLAGRTWLRGSLLCVVAAVATTAQAIQAGELDAKFRAAKARIVTELRSPKQEVRDGAIEKLRDYPTPEAADLLLQQGELTKFPDVRRGCYDLLRSFANTEAVGQSLQNELLQAIKTNKVDQACKVRLIVLLVSTEPKVTALLSPLLDQAGQSPAGLLLLATLIDEFAETADADSKRALLLLAEQPLFTTHSGLRRALVQALCKLNEKQAVTQLLQFYTTAEGETRADIERRMLQISGLKAEERTDWPSWWQEKEATFVFPSGPPREPEVVARPGSASYYGLPVYGSRIVFIADYSGSMQGVKMDAAKRELIATIAQLPDGVRFNVIAFNSEVIPWKRELQTVSPQSRKEAMAFVGSGQAAAMTASYTALHAGLLQDCDAIYFLTDGEPTVGQITKPDAIIAAISRTNRVRRATINCIGIGVGGQGGAFDVFLSDLAAKNFGAYRKIN